MRFWDQVPLKRAAQLDYADIVQYLCDNGADLEAECYVRDANMTWLLF